MKLLTKHKNLWMLSCAEVLFPRDEIKELEEQREKLLTKAYKEHYEVLYKPIENQLIFRNLQRQAADTCSFSINARGQRVITDLHSLERSRPYTGRGEVASKGFSRIAMRHTLPVSLGTVVANQGNPIPDQYRPQGYTQTHRGVNLLVSQETYALCEKYAEQLEAIKTQFDEKMITVYKVLQSCSTHKQLLEKSPGIYSNMPAEVKQLYDAQARRQMNSSPSEKKTTVDETLDTEAEVPEDLDTALAVAAFVKQ